MKKLLSLFVLLVAIVTGAWAGTETPGNSGTKDTQLTGTSYSIGGTYIAGAGSTKIGDMETKGVKIRTNQNSNTLVISVNEGYRIDGLTIYGVSNDNNKAVEVSGVSIDGVAQTFTSVTFPKKTSTESATIALTDIAATNDITLSFGTNAGTQLNLDLHFTYTQTEVITQEITAASIYGAALSAEQLATLKSTNALTIDGSSYNGVGVLGVTLNSGAVTPTMAISGNDAVYTFSLNSGADEYTVTVTGVKKTYTAQGTVVYYDADALSNSDKTLTIDDIAFNYASKTFGYANNTAGVTIGSTTYKPIKLSTGEAVTVTFPTGKVATKIIVYGWSVGGNGKLVNFTDGGEKSVDTSGDIFYGEDLAANVYPSVYEYDVDNWEAFTFQGNGGQPFVVFDFVLANAGPVDPVLSVNKASVSVGETAKILLGGKDEFNDYFTAGSLWESEGDGPYITLSNDGTITPIKVTPAGYFFTFTANTRNADAYNSKVGQRIDFAVTAPTYTVTYDLNGGNGDAPTQDATEEGGSFNLAAAPAKDFTNFAGWLCSADDQVYEAGAAYTMTAANTTFTAQWTGTTYSSTLDFGAITEAGTTADNAIADFLASGNMISSTLGSSAWETSTAKSGFVGYKLKNSGATVKFMAKAGKRVTITLGSVSDDVTLKKNGVSETISANKGDAYQTLVSFDADEDVLVEIVTTTKNTVTLNKIAIEDAIAATNVAVGTTGFATIGLPYATTLPTGVTAYAVSSVEGSKVVMSEAIAAETVIPANRGLVIMADPANSPYAFAEFVGTQQFDLSGNELKATGASAKAATAEGDFYYFAIINAEKQKVGFKKCSATASLAANKAYLPGSLVGGGANALTLEFAGEATGINGIADEAQAEDAPAKVVKNGKLYIGNYNVAGQQVK